MTRTIKSRLYWLAIFVGLAVVIYLLLTGSTIFRRGVEWLLGILNIAADVFLAIVLPLAFLGLCAFVYRVWGKAWFRALHIRRIRNTRQLREAADRSNIQE